MFKRPACVTLDSVKELWKYYGPVWYPTSSPTPSITHILIPTAWSPCLLALRDPWLSFSNNFLDFVHLVLLHISATQSASFPKVDYYFNFEQHQNCFRVNKCRGITGKPITLPIQIHRPSPPPPLPSSPFVRGVYLNLHLVF